jgi:hypothetical protein
LFPCKISPTIFKINMSFWAWRQSSNPSWKSWIFQYQLGLTCINNIPFIVGNKLVFIEGHGGKHILHICDKQTNVMDVSQGCHIGCLEGIGICSNIYLMDGYEARGRDKMDECLGTLTTLTYPIRQTWQKYSLKIYE